MEQITVTHRGKTYQVGAADVHHEPLPLPHWLDTLSAQPGWQEIDTSHWTGRPDRTYARAYRSKKGLLVLVSCAEYEDFRCWLHVSVSRKDTCVPTWEQMSLVKALFIGEERQAVQIMPPASKHVNIHHACLHLWHCMDGDGIPDMTTGGETI